MISDMQTVDVSRNTHTHIHTRQVMSLCICRSNVAEVVLHCIFYS